jgi:hypothetical protein
MISFPHDRNTAISCWKPENAGKMDLRNITIETALSLYSQHPHYSNALVYLTNSQGALFRLNYFFGSTRGQPISVPVYQLMEDKYNIPELIEARDLCLPCQHDGNFEEPNYILLGCIRPEKPTELSLGTYYTIDTASLVTFDCYLAVEMKIG